MTSKTSRILLAGVLSVLAAAPLPAQDPPSADYYVYVAAESADEVYKVRFDGTAAEVVKVIDVGYLPTEIEGPHGLTIEPDGTVSYCIIQSSDMGAAVLERQVAERVRTFDFGAKTDIPAITILYPIDFLPAA